MEDKKTTEEEDKDDISSTLIANAFAKNSSQACFEHKRTTKAQDDAQDI